MYELVKIFAFVVAGICIGVWLIIFRIVTDHEKELDDEAQREFLNERKDKRGRWKNDTSKSK